MLGWKAGIFGGWVPPRWIWMHTSVWWANTAIHFFLTVRAIALTWADIFPWSGSKHSSQLQPAVSLEQIQRVTPYPLVMEKNTFFWKGPIFPCDVWLPEGKVWPEICNFQARIAWFVVLTLQEEWSLPHAKKWCPFCCSSTSFRLESRLQKTSTKCEQGILWPWQHKQVSCLDAGLEHRSSLTATWSAIVFRFPAVWLVTITYSDWFNHYNNYSLSIVMVK